MKTLRRNIRVVCALVLGLFVAFFAYFSYSVYFFGGRWFANPFNPRISSQKQVVQAGTITDRTGVVLAYTDNQGDRRYASDAKTRQAVAHVIGDSGGNVSSGVETFHAQYLLGFKASLAERITQLFAGDDRRGDDIELTISAKLNTYISEQFPSGKAGAVVLLNYRTGDIYALVSKPDFDPNKIARIKEDPNSSALFNRATLGTYPPGSTFKIVTLASAFQYIPDVRSRRFDCTGYLPLAGGQPVTDAGNNVHGTLTVDEAFAKSCNVTFAALTQELGYDRMARTAADFGVGDNFLFRDLVVSNSKYPTDTPTQDDLAWSGVGQGRVMVSPLHMALITAGVANGGVMMEPKLLKQVTGPNGQRRLVTEPRVYKQAVSPELAAILKADMFSVIQSGTGGNAKMSGYHVGGKTGSAEFTNDKTIETHAWYVGFIDDDAHPLAIAVVVEHGGSGGQVAAPLAKKFLTKALSLGL